MSEPHTFDFIGLFSKEGQNCVLLGGHWGIAPRLNVAQSTYLCALATKNMALTPTSSSMLRASGRKNLGLSTEALPAVEACVETTP